MASASLSVWRESQRGTQWSDEIDLGFHSKIPGRIPSELNADVRDTTKPGHAAEVADSGMRS